MARRVRLLPAPGTSLLAEVDEASGRPAGPLGVGTMVSWLLAQQSARGGEVRNLKAAPHSKGRWHEVNTRRFRWHTVLSVPWTWPEAINVAEARAHDLAVAREHWHRRWLAGRQVFLANWWLRDAVGFRS